MTNPATTSLAGVLLLVILPLSTLQAAPPVFSPHAHLRATTGLSSADSDEDFAPLAPGAHDPDDPDFSLQAIELGATLRADRFLEGFFTANLFLDGDDDPDAEAEEALLAIRDLPWGIGIRGGRFLNRYGLHNSSHLHAWDLVDQNLPHALLLGDEGLVTDGAEISLALPTPNRTLLTFSYGQAPEHGHEHGHDHEHEHGHDVEEGDRDAPLPALTDDLFTANLIAELPYNDFHIWRATSSFATGATTEGNSDLYGLGLEYQWRENGYDPGGRGLRLRWESFYRTGKNADLFGLTSSAVLTVHDRLDLALRGDYIDDLNRLRLSPAVTFRPFASADPTSASSSPYAHLRLQYNYDQLPGSRHEHGLFLQLALGWGAH